MPLDPTAISAIFSPCRRYRYVWRYAFSNSPSLIPRTMCGGIINFILLNPSTADETKADPTITRCIRRGFKLDAREVIITNLFSWRATEPKHMIKAHARGVDVIGDDNDDWLIRCARAADMVVCGWGNHGKLIARSKQVRDMMTAHDIQPYQLLETGQGEPQHPLYVSYGIEPSFMHPISGSILRAP